MVPFNQVIVAHLKTLCDITSFLQVLLPHIHIRSNKSCEILVHISLGDGWSHWINKSKGPSPVSAALTTLIPRGSDAVEEAEVVDLAVPVLYVQLCKAKVDPVATRHADLPLTHRVVWVCPRVTQRGQSPTAGAKHTGATAVTCRATQTQSQGKVGGRNKTLDF